MRILSRLPAKHRAPVGLHTHDLSQESPAGCLTDDPPRRPLLEYFSKTSYQDPQSLYLAPVYILNLFFPFSALAHHTPVTLAFCLFLGNAILSCLRSFGIPPACYNSLCSQLFTWLVRNVITSKGPLITLSFSHLYVPTINLAYFLASIKATRMYSKRSISLLRH